MSTAADVSMATATDGAIDKPAPAQAEVSRHPVCGLSSEPCLLSSVNVLAYSDNDLHLAFVYSQVLCTYIPCGPVLRARCLFTCIAGAAAAAFVVCAMFHCSTNIRSSLVHPSQVSKYPRLLSRIDRFKPAARLILYQLYILYTTE